MGILTRMMLRGQRVVCVYEASACSGGFMINYGIRNQFFLLVYQERNLIKHGMRGKSALKRTQKTNVKRIMNVLVID